MIITTDIKNNKIDLIFEENISFNPNILSDLCDELAKLNPDKIINIYCNGLIYIEVAVYLLEVSKNAKLIIHLEKEDINAKRFLEFSMFIENSKIQIKYK